MKTVKEEMNIDIWEKELDRTHLVGNPNVSKDGKPSPLFILLSLSRYLIII